eukprot:CAMPEP_0205920594 /NCGR_PEP_ID=MMETSP1325-20131115/11455_1 /ASSEMBLY_ACC=CAM_ASM_000708 /TAXON_ID=236786 /ORGANISM="Florenciella sp., Strain RCC1007" /LENGTH=62 /DNA_ID=CAMNT_0053288295 /DNA_START=195 /DNA_END=379 /DNA_ORIENTATION=-
MAVISCRKPPVGDARHGWKQPAGGRIGLAGAQGHVMVCVVCVSAGRGVAGQAGSVAASLCVG